MTKLFTIFAGGVLAFGLLAGCASTSGGSHKCSHGAAESCKGGKCGTEDCCKGEKENCEECSKHK
ncbi:MAG: hypothetical protein AB7O96_02795 [Pseudobdellovibrionaceae bacterium]